MLLRNKEDNSPRHASTPSKIFHGVRFLLLGFESIEQANKVRSMLISGGGVEVAEYVPRCTHLIVDRIVYDDSECIVARSDGKTVTTPLWVQHCIDLGMLVDATNILYRPVKDLNGIPGAKSLFICLTGYQKLDRDDIMRMVGLMGAHFSKPLVANTVTHLICYKFEGEKYELAKKMKKIKLVNHCWLEDCLRAWEILPECNYSKSGHELELMEAEAKDSEEETEEIKNSKLYEENVTENVFTSHEGSSAMIWKGSDMPMVIKKNEVAVKTLPDDINEKRLSSPSGKAGSGNVPESHEVHRKGEDFMCQKTEVYDGSNACKEGIEASSNLATAKRTPYSNAATTGVRSYLRKPPVRSPVSKFSGFVSNNVSASSPADSEFYNVKDCSNVCVPQLDQLQSKQEYGKKQTLRDDSELQLEGGESHALPLKRNAFLSNASYGSLSEASANLKAWAAGSPSARARTEELDIGSPHMQFSFCHDNGGKCFEKNDVRSSAIHQSPNFPKSKSLKIDSKPSHEQPISSSTLSLSAETSGLGLELSKSANSKTNIGHKETYRSTNDQLDTKADHGEQHQNIVNSPLKSGECETDKSRSSADLGEHKGSSKESVLKQVSKKTVIKKGTASKSKQSSGNNKQKGSLCLNRRSIQEDKAISPLTEEGKATKTEKALGVIAEVVALPSKTEFVDEKKATGGSSSENNVEKAVSSEDDETEAPDEDIVAKLENAARVEMTNSIPQANIATKKKLKAMQSPVLEMKTGIARRENATLTQEKDEEVAEGDKCNSHEMGGSILRDEIAEGGYNVFNKSKRKAVSVARKMEKSGKDKEVETDKIIDNKMEAKKRNKLQHAASELKSKPIFVDTMEKSMNLKKDDNPIDNVDPIQGRKHLLVKGKEHLPADAKRSETSIKGKRIELEVTNDGKISLEKTKEVPCFPSKPKSKTRSVKDAPKDMREDEKENNPVETVGLANSSECKGGSIATKTGKIPAGSHKGVHRISIHATQPSKGLKFMRPEPVSFILSGHRLQRKEFQKIIKRLSGKVCRDSHNWSYQATHFIVPDPIKRTEKFFAAAASGRWILKTDYLTASNQAGNLLPEEPYEWFKTGFSEDSAINLEAPRKWRLLRERTGHGAFYGMRIIIYGECIAPTLDTLKRVVKAGDGVILATSPPYTRFLKSGVDFAVVSSSMPRVDSWVQEFLRHEIPCVVADYLVEYVCKAGCSLERHVLYSTHAWAEKSFANLLSRSEEIVEDLMPTKDSECADISCRVCGSRDRAEVMLICGDESGSLGCGVGSHIDCCDPPLEAVPEDDWFCPNCSEGRISIHPRKKTKKGSSSSKCK